MKSRLVLIILLFSFFKGAFCLPQAIQHNILNDKGDQRNLQSDFQLRTGEKKSKRDDFSCTEWCTLTGKMGKQIIKSLSAAGYGEPLDTHPQPNEDSAIIAYDLCHGTSETVGSSEWCKTHCLGEGGFVTRAKGLFQKKSRKEKVKEYMNEVNKRCWGDDAAPSEKDANNPTKALYP